MKKAMGVLVGLFLVAAGLLAYFYQYMQKDIIYSNVFINQIPVGEMTRERAKEVLREKQSYKNIIFRYEDKEYSYSLEELGFLMDYDQAVQSAYQIGRQGAFFENLKQVARLKVLHNQESVTLNFRENIPALMEKVGKINSENYVEPRDASISIENNYAIKKEIVGRKIELDKVESLIMQHLKPNEDIVIDLPIKRIMPKLTSEGLKRINGKIGQFSTRFNSSIAGRVENIKVATGSVNSTVLAPGEEFSFNKTTGDRGLADGYKEASIIINGKYEKGVAGGVCQVSTTLYNAALYAGLDITRRRPHSIPAGYVDIGRDAAVVSGEFDLRFKNPYDYPILLKGYVSGNTVVFQVYGDVNTHKKVNLTSKTVSRIPRKVIYRNDPTLPKGKQVVEEAGRDEIHSITYMTINGETKVINKDRYPAKAQVVRVGTGAVPKKPAAPATTPPASASPAPAQPQGGLFGDAATVN